MSEIDEKVTLPEVSEAQSSSTYFAKGIITKAEAILAHRKYIYAKNNRSSLINILIEEEYERLFNPKHNENQEFPIAFSQ